MKRCDICGRDGVEVLSTTIEGRLLEIHLCDRCVSTVRKNHMSAMDVVEVCLNAKGKFCPTCGTTVKDFDERFMFGCADCYKYMRGVALSSAEKVQQSTHHVGKRGFQNG